MKNYGEMFKYLRKNKGMTLKELAEDGISVSLIAQFEKGQSKISFDRLVILLNKMSVAVVEFLQLVNHGKIAKEDELMMSYYELINSPDTSLPDPFANIDFAEKEAAIKVYVKTNPSLKLEHFLIYMKLYQRIKGNFASKASLKSFNKELSELARPIKDYLFQVDVWGVYELELLNRMSICFEPPILWRLVQQSIKRADSYRELPGLNDLVYQTLFSNLTTFVAFEAFDYAFKTLNLINAQLKTKESIRFAATLPFYEGWIYYFLEEEERAQAGFAKTIKIYDDLGLTTSANTFRKLRTNLKHSKDEGTFLVMLLL